MLLDTIPGAGAELVHSPARLGYSDDRNVEVAALDHALQRRKDLFVCQIASCAEKHESIRMNWCHRSLLTSRSSRDVPRSPIASPTGVCPDSPIRRGN